MNNNFMIRTKSAIGLAFTAVALCLVQSASFAASYTVTSTNDTGPNSLRAIITTANAAIGSSIITFDSSGAFAGGGTVNLQTPLPLITNSLTITGVAGTPTVISGGGNLQLFTFAAGTTNTLSNLVLANGKTAGNGAAISNCGSLFLTGCTISNNIATNANGCGGAIFNSGTLSASPSFFGGNNSLFGGGI